MRISLSRPSLFVPVLNSLVTADCDLAAWFSPSLIWVAQSCSLTRWAPPWGFIFLADVYPRIHTLSCCLLFNVFGGVSVCARRFLLCVSESFCVALCWLWVGFVVFVNQWCCSHHLPGGYGDWQKSCRGFDNNRSVSLAEAEVSLFLLMIKLIHVSVKVRARMCVFTSQELQSSHGFKHNITALSKYTRNWIVLMITQ